MVALKPQALETLELVSPAGTRTIRPFGAKAKILGKGGAGVVLSHPELPGQAVKIYASSERADAHAAKLAAMLEAPPQGTRTPLGTVQIAWPTARAMSGGRLVGFAMPEIDFAQAWTLQQVIQPSQRARRGIPDRMEFRLYAARNLVSVLQSLHRAGHYVIDLKPQNVLVYRENTKHSAAHVALVDCDGFQIRDPRGGRFDAELATPQFLHPDVARQVGDEAGFDARLLNDKAELQDDFALAVILFQLLNDGLHPMSGQETGQGVVPPDLATRLQGGARFYAYGQGQPNPALRPDPDSLHQEFDGALRALFDRAFAGRQAPPAPQEWAAALARLCDGSRRCLVNPAHWKLGDTCGACAREDRRRALAAVQMAVPAAPSIPKPLPIKRPLPLVAGTRVMSSARRRRRSKGIAILGLGAVAGLAGFFLIPSLASNLAQSPQRVGPSFDCGRVHVALGQVICGDATLSRQELQFVQAYQALRQQVGASGQPLLRKQAVDFQAQVIAACALPAAQPASPELIRTATSCVADQYNGQRSLWLSNLTGEARQEATRAPERHIALQRRLQALGFLPATATIDGVYGSGTRVAIEAWQHAQNLPITGLLGDAAAERLDPAATTAASDARGRLLSRRPGDVLSYLQTALGGLLGNDVGGSTASAPSTAAASTAPSSQPIARSWATASGLVGQNIGQIFSVPEIAAAVQRVAGSAYNEIFDDFSGLGGDGVLVENRYVVGTGCARHSCGFEESFLALDLVSHSVYAAVAAQDSTLKTFPAVSDWPSAATRAAGPWVTRMASNNKHMNAFCFPRTLPADDKNHLETVAGTFEIHSEGSYNKTFLVGDSTCTELADNEIVVPDMVWPASGPIKVLVFEVSIGAACDSLFSTVDFRKPPFTMSELFGNCSYVDDRRVVGSDLIYSFGRTGSDTGPRIIHIPLGD